MGAGWRAKEIPGRLKGDVPAGIRPAAEAVGIKCGAFVCRGLTLRWSVKTGSKTWVTEKRFQRGEEMCGGLRVCIFDEFAR